METTVAGGWIPAIGGTLQVLKEVRNYGRFFFVLESPPDTDGLLGFYREEMEGL